MNSTSLRYIPGLIYFVVSLAILIAKFITYKVTSSEAVFSDAMESIVNVVAAALTFYILYKGRKPHPDFPYGTGKLEYVSSTAEGGLLAFASLFIIIQAIPSLFKPSPIFEFNFGMIMIFATGFINLILGLFLKYQSKKMESVALDMSGTHILSDVVTSLGVLLGLFLVQQTGFIFIDSLIALSIAGFIGYLSIKHLKSAMTEILDKANPQWLKKLEHIFNTIEREGFIQIHQVKLIRSGDFHHIDAHFVMPEFWDVKKIHEEICKLEEKINELYDKKVELGVHLDPCRRAYCKHCDVSSCEIRKEKFINKLEASMEQMRSPIEPESFMLKN